MGTSVEIERGNGVRKAFAIPLVLVSDETLASRVRAGDERSFEQLYTRYRDRLFQYCASILRQPQDAEEALQSAMFNAYCSLVDREERELAIRPWLYRIAHNQCVAMLRRRPAHPTQPLTGFEVLPAQGMAERIETAERLTGLRQDMLALPDDQRGALVLRELSGLSHAQIAEVLNESAASVKQLIYRARTGLYAMAEGRTLRCDIVRRRISDGDGRVLGSRVMGAHLRTCVGRPFGSDCVGGDEGAAGHPPPLPKIPSAARCARSCTWPDSAYERSARRPRPGRPSRCPGEPPGPPPRRLGPRRPCRRRPELGSWVRVSRPRAAGVPSRRAADTPRP